MKKIVIKGSIIEDKEIGHVFGSDLKYYVDGERIEGTLAELIEAALEVEPYRAGCIFYYTNAPVHIRLDVSYNKFKLFKSSFSNIELDEIKKGKEELEDLFDKVVSFIKDIEEWAKGGQAHIEYVHFVFK